jgi:hypothetical protein
MSCQDNIRDRPLDPGVGDSDLCHSSVMIVISHMWLSKIKEFQKTPTSDFEFRLVQHILIPSSLNFVETFLVSYRAPRFF